MIENITLPVSPSIDYTKQVKGHARGLIYFFEKNNFFYVPVPKVASTSFRSMGNFRGLSLNSKKDQEFIEEKRRQGCKVVTVLRDPVERFVSIYLEVMHREFNDKSTEQFRRYRAVKSFDERMKLLLCDIKNDFSINPHFPPQSFYTGGYHFDYVYGIRELGKMKNIGVGVPRVYAKPGDKKKDISNRIQNNGEYRKAILEIYEADVALYNMTGK